MPDSLIINERPARPSSGLRRPRHQRTGAKSVVAIARDEVDAAVMQLRQAREWPRVVAAAEVGGQKLTRFSAEPIRSLSDALIKLEYAVKNSRADRINDALFAEVVTYLRSQVAG